MKHRVVFCDGSFVSEEHASISINDRAFLYGDGIFTTAKVKMGKVRCLQEHLNRMKSQAQELELPLPVINLSWIDELIHRNQAQNGFWRLKIIFTAGDEHQSRQSSKSNGKLIMTLKPYLNLPVDPCRLAVFTTPFIRPLAKFKTLAYLDRFYIMEFAKKQGFDDALTVNAEGMVLETAFSNIFWFQSDQIFTPAPSLPLLSGIALSIAQKALIKLHLSWNEVFVKWSDIPLNASYYICNALTDIRPVIQIEDKHFERNFHFEKVIKETYEKIVNEA